MKIKDINQGVRKAAAETGFKIGKEIIGELITLKAI